VGYFVAVWDFEDRKQSMWFNVYVMLREQDVGI